MITRAELRIPVTISTECDNCSDRFACLTSNELTLYADYLKAKRTHDGITILEFGFTISGGTFLRGCIKGDVLFRIIVNHNIKSECLFYGDYKLYIVSHSFTIDYEETSEKLVIEAKIMR